MRHLVLLNEARMKELLASSSRMERRKAPHWQASRLHLCKANGGVAVQHTHGPGLLHYQARFKTKPCQRDLKGILATLITVWQTRSESKLSKQIPRYGACEARPDHIRGLKRFRKSHVVGIATLQR